MYTKMDLISHLDALRIDPKGTLLVHLSYKAIGDVEGRADTVLDALSEYMAPGLLVIPAHTWDNVGKENPVMDVLYTPTCVGILTELFRKRPGVFRSLHPTHSLAAKGAEAEDFLSGEERVNTPCGKGGAYYRLWERNAYILHVGVNYTTNTFIHGIEEWDNAYGAISEKATDLYVINYQGNRLHTPQFRHCSPLGSDTFGKLEPHAYKRNIMSFGRFGDAMTRLARAVPFREMAAEFLRENAKFLYYY